MQWSRWSYRCYSEVREVGVATNWSAETSVSGTWATALVWGSREGAPSPLRMPLSGGSRCTASKPLSRLRNHFTLAGSALWLPSVSASGRPPKRAAAQVPVSPVLTRWVGLSLSLPLPPFCFSPPPPHPSSFFMENIDPLRGGLIFAKCFISYYFVDTFNCTVTLL